MKRVAVIGGGPSGIVSAKHLLSNGLEPVIFDKSSKPCGLWARSNNENESTAIWKGMTSNISRYTQTFSDYPWIEFKKHNKKDKITIFPTANDINEYLTSYIDYFKLNQHFKLNTNVKQLSQVNENKWKVDYQCEKNSNSEIFDHVIVASGVHSVPRIPFYSNSNKFKGHLLHSSQFESVNNEKFKDKNVVVVGCGWSATEISSLLVGHAKTVTSLFNRPYLIIGRLCWTKMVNSDNKIKIIPNDFLFYNRSSVYLPDTLSKDEKIKSTLDRIYDSCQQQMTKETSPPELYYDFNQMKQLNFAVSDDYFHFVKENKIKAIKSKINDFRDGNLIELSNGNEINADAVIFCTGYDLETNFLSQSIKDIIKYDDNNYKFPYLTYKCTLHPDLVNLAFVGQNEGLFFSGYELQAKWASMVK
jgi:dimethylaniline monooxygenase (N-oxide forming)